MYSRWVSLPVPLATTWPLAIPMWALFELGVIFARFYVKKDEDDSDPEGWSDEEAEDEFDRIEAEEAADDNYANNAEKSDPGP